MMDDAMKAYLGAIGITDAAVGRVEYVYEMFEFLCPEKIESIFVSDTVDATSSQRELESLVAFSETFWLQSRQFLTSDNADVSLYAQSVWYLGIDSQDLKLGAPDSESARLVVEVETGSDLYTRLSATGVNCKFLLSIAEKFVLPNLRRE